MTKPKATDRRPQGPTQWVESQKKLFGATATAVFDDFMDWYRANVHGVRNVTPKGVKRVSGNGAGTFTMLVKYEIKATSHPS
jgi:hypothetical protein